MKPKKSTRGGARKGAGRKPLGDQAMKRVDVTLGAQHIDKAQNIGDGNLSLGIRIAVDEWRK